MNRILKNPISVFILILVSYLVGLGYASVPLTGDQKIYLSIAREMMDRKEWIVPYLFGEPNFLKPPFQYWMTILGWYSLGFGMWGALIPSVIALIVSAGVIYQIARLKKMDQPRIAALVFSSTIATLTFGTTSQMEIWIVLFYCLAWWMILKDSLLSAFGAVGIMAWIKGPLYPVLFTLSVGLFRIGLLRQKRFWISLLMGMVLGLLWYGLVARTHSSEMMDQFFYTENLGKWSTQQGSILSLWSEFLITLFPWLPILVVAAFQTPTRKIWKKDLNFLLGFSMIPAIFFTFFPYRVNTYLYLLTPLVAWMISVMDFTSIGKKTTAVLMSVYGTFFLTTGFLFYVIFQAKWITDGFSTWICMGWIGSMALILSALFRKSIYGFSWGAIILIMSIRLAGVGLGQTDLQGLTNYPEVTKRPLSMIKDHETMWHESGWLSVALGQPIQLFKNGDESDIFLAKGGLLILQDEQERWIQPRHQCQPWRRFKKRIRFPFRDGISGRVDLDSNDYFRTYWICSARQLK